MTVLFNITSVTVGSAGETLETSNSGWTRDNDATGGTGALKVTDANTPNSIYCDAADTSIYVRTGSEAPGSGNVTFKVDLERMGTGGTGVGMYLCARVQGTRSTWVGVLINNDGTCQLVKSIAGSRTNLTGNSAMTAFVTSAGNVGTAEIVIAKTGTNNSSIAYYWTGTDATRRVVHAATTFTDSQLDGNGELGIMQRFANVSGTTGIHFVPPLYAEDDTGSAATIAGDNGTYSVTGQAAGLLATRKITAEQGTYSLSGQDATLTKFTSGAFTLTADQGSYTITGSDALADYSINAATSTYSITGYDATLTYSNVINSYTLTANTSTYSLSGRSANLIWSNAPPTKKGKSQISLSMKMGL